MNSGINHNFSGGKRNKTQRHTQNLFFPTLGPTFVALMALNKEEKTVWVWSLCWTVTTTMSILNSPSFQKKNLEIINFFVMPEFYVKRRHTHIFCPHLMCVCPISHQKKRCQGFISMLNIGFLTRKVLEL